MKSEFRMPSRKKRYIVLMILASMVLFALPASAQDDKTPVTVDLGGATGSVSLQHELQTTAQVELVVGDQLYHLTVPVKVQLDTSTVLSDATLAGPVSQQVGVLLIEPTEIERIEGDYEKEYRTISPGPENVVVVYRADVTNLMDEVLETGYESKLDAFAIDEVGNRYEDEEKICSDINPGEKVSCEFIFDVPATANLVGLDVETMAHKEFDFSGLAVEQ